MWFDARPWRPEWILYEDDDVVAVDKPVGVATHAAERGRRDDCVSRVRAFLAERSGVPERDVYLGVHQRLDQDTSGVLLLARRREANAGLARAFEGRDVEKVYLAGVVGWPRDRRRGELVHALAPDRDGRVRVARRGERGADEARSSFEVLRRREDRALVQLRPRTGRTHQLRVQVRALEARIAGDRLYGPLGRAAESDPPRMLLHAASLALPHPVTGAPLRVESPPPDVFARWLDGLALEREGEVAAVVRAAADRRWRWLEPLAREQAEVTALRVVHDAGDGLAGWSLDLYRHADRAGDAWLVATESVPHATGAPDARAREVLAACGDAGVRGVYLKRRPPESARLVDPRDARWAPPDPVIGLPAPEAFAVREHGVRYLVSLGDGLSTGIFLDQRENRRRVREAAGEQRVANLFAYHGAFTVAAAAGGARATTSVDLSAPALARIHANLRDNGLAADAHALVDADVLDWLPAAAADRRERYDLVIVDPPSYASARGRRFAAEHDYPALARAVLAIVAPAGRVLFCTNHRGIVRAKLRRWLHEAARAAGRALAQLKDLPDPPDYPPAPGREAHLKSVLLSLAD